MIPNVRRNRRDERLEEAELRADSWREKAFKERERANKVIASRERIVGAYKQIILEARRLRADNVRLAEKLVEVATRPPTIIQPPATPQLDLPAILAEVRKAAVGPDVVYEDRPDSPDIQRRGTNWQDQGLDNTGGTRHDVRDPFDTDVSPNDIPDYVLDVERLDPATLNGGKGGWFNPPSTTITQTPPTTP